MPLSLPPPASASAHNNQPQLNEKLRFDLILIDLLDLCQWSDHENQKAVYIGPKFKKSTPCLRDVNSNYVFVTLGTSDMAFTRYILSIEELKKEGSIHEKVIVQAGNTKHTPEHLELFDLCAPERIDEFIRNARYVVTQESAGIVTLCLKYQTPFLVMPRDYKTRELP